MNFIRVFNTDSEYITYRSGGGYKKPNVSYSRDIKEVHYNYPPKSTSNTNNGHEYVDLGLTSGTKWAIMNVGASKPSDFGLYFQWGETTGYIADQVGTVKQFTWNSYKFNPSGDGSTFTKYTITGATLELVDDAAHVNMGGDWHMPSPEQCQELMDETTSAWTTSDGVSGITFTSKKDTSKFIFFPAEGGAWDSSIQSKGREGSIWVSKLDTDSISRAYRLFYNSDGPNLSSWGGRYGGRSLRGVVD